MKKLYSDQTPIRRTIHPDVKVIDEKSGMVQYVASDESLDGYYEIVKASGARFNRFQKNAPFVDSHNYESIECLLGQVVDWRIENRQVVETVKWAIDANLPEDHLANIGFKMTVAGYLKAVSIGFLPLVYVTKWDSNQSAFLQACQQMDIGATNVRAIFLEWEQMELSACVIGANPNAVAKAYKAGVLSDAALEKISAGLARRETAPITDDPAVVMEARQRAQNRFLLEYQSLIAQL